MEPTATELLAEQRVERALKAYRNAEHGFRQKARKKLQEAVAHSLSISAYLNRIRRAAHS